MGTLKLAANVQVPLDLATESNAVLGKKGSGKTNALVVLIEELHRANVPIVSIDPKGDHWGIRAAHDGNPGSGLPIPVFGGLHGDIPLEPTAGTAIATLIRDRNLSVILDVSEFTGADRRRFLTALAEGLYRHASREPMHLILEEAHEYIPQRVDSGDAPMVGAFERLVKLGRYKGLGVTMASQRSASLNKNVLTQVDNLIIMRMLSPQDRAAVRAWVDTHADAGTIIDTLPSLQTGEAWLWQPERGEPIRFRFRPRDTFDAGSTPKPGEKPRTPATLADIDLAEVQTLMSDTIERAKADDPRELRRRIAELTRENARLIEEADADLPLTEVTVEVQPAWLPGALGKILTSLEDSYSALDAALDLTRDLIDRANDLPGPIDDVPTLRRPSTTSHTPPALAAAAVATPESPGHLQPSTQRDGADGRLGKAERAILSALVQHGTLTMQRLALLSGYSVKSSSLANALGSLRTKGYVNRGGRSDIAATPEGITALGPVQPLPTGPALIHHWMANLGKAERALLASLINAYPNTLDNTALAEASGYSASSSSFANALGRLRSLQLSEGDRNANRATDTLGEAKGQ